jgi:peroxiredoxin
MISLRGHLRTSLAALAAAGLLAWGTARAVAAPTPPKVGDIAPAFTLRTLDDRVVELSRIRAQGRVVLVVLRGWPGYQCPLCAQQVREFVLQAPEFASRGARVVMVYPGPAENLKAHAREFLQDQQWPADFDLVLDPGFEFTHAYGLRWDARKETAYPSTFIVDRPGHVRFAHVSKSHGDRVTVPRVLAELK